MVHAPCDLGVNMMSSPNAVSGSIGAGGPMGWGSFSRSRKMFLWKPVITRLPVHKQTVGLHRSTHKLQGYSVSRYCGHRSYMY